MKKSTAETYSEAKQSQIASEAKQCQVTELKITGYNSEAVKILFEYVAGKLSPLAFLKNQHDFDCLETISMFHSLNFKNQ